MNLLRSILVAVAVLTLAACASLPARPAGGMVADLTEDVPLLSQYGLSGDFATEAQRIDVQQRAWKVIAERYYDPRLNGEDWPAIRDKYRPRVAGAKTDAQLYLALKSMARELNDSHTRVVTPRESADRRRFAALATGAALNVIDDQLVIIDVSPESLVIETTGTEDKIDSLLEVLRPYGVMEMVRTGRVAMARGSGPTEKPASRSAQPASATPADLSSGSV